MKNFLSILTSLVLALPACLLGEVITQPVVNIFIGPTENTEVDSQAIYGSFVQVVDQSNKDWVKIKTTDNVEGWVRSSQITSHPAFEKSDKLRSVKNRYAHLYRVTDTTPLPPIMTIPFRAQIKLEDVADKGERWVPIELVSGEKAWIQRGDIEYSPKVKTLEEMLAFSKEFLGLPYTWGGTSSYGYDCSGFMQMLFKEMGYLLPRNSRDQANSDLFVAVNRENLQPGDLVFFGESKIVHVGLYLGNDEYIHSGVVDKPIIMVTNLNNGKLNLLACRRLKQKQ